MDEKAEEEGKKQRLSEGGFEEVNEMKA